MEKRKFQWEWIAGFAMMLFLVLALGIEAQAIKEESGEQIEQRADLIVIDTRPEVLFLHDLHTDALEKLNKDCTRCHMPEKPESTRLSPKFKRLEDPGRDELEDLYRSECLGCHKELAKAGQKGGPLNWEDCAKKNVGAVSSLKPFGLDKSLHFRHTKETSAPCQKYQWAKAKPTNKGDCGVCHHEYDEATKKLFYAKGKEGSCRYCHMKETEDNRISMRLASHYACIECHQKKLSEKINSGPYRCSGCHDLASQQKIKKLDAVPRIERRQPDVVLIKATEPGAEKDAQAVRMNAVPFDHKAHEAYNDTCIICHHPSLDSCTNKCHTTKGSKDGDFVSLEQAMHRRNCEESCLGCHQINQTEARCAACHAFMAENRKQLSSCFICHIKSQQEDESTPALDNNVVAETLLQSRRATSDTYKDEDIPEKVVIKGLEDKYEPVEMPHRKIVQALLNNIKDNKLALYFHTEKGTVCQGCHHNSPLDVTPPGCVSCHGTSSDGQNMLRPGIKGAYHQQCMGCHKVLKLEKPKSVGCTDCHKEKTQVVKAD